MLDLPSMQTRQKVEQVKAYLTSLVSSKIPTTHSTKPWKTQEDADLDGTSLGWIRLRTQYCDYASWPRNGKGTQTNSGISVRHSCLKTWESTIRKGQQAKLSDIKLLIQENSKPQDLIVWFSHQRPVRVGLHCQARWCSLYCLNLQLDDGGGSSHTCPPLDCLKMWQSDHTCHHPHRFNELATESERWNGKPRLECVNGWHPHLKTPVGVLPWTYWSEGMTEMIFLKRMRAVINQMNFETVPKVTLGKLLRDGVEWTWAFLRTQISLNWTQLGN